MTIAVYSLQTKRYESGPAKRESFVEIQSFSHLYIDQYAHSPTYIINDDDVDDDDDDVN
jgi:hypothetical protein